MDAKTFREDRARSLEIFAAVVAQGSFSAAGRLLDLTPSAVSRAIDRLEERLGVRLLLRSTRALTLTAEGHAYLCGARRILSDLDEVEQEISDQGAPRGRLSPAPADPAVRFGRRTRRPLRFSLICCVRTGVIT